MTDIRPNTASLQPHRSVDEADSREVAMRTLAARAAPRVPPGAAASLADKVLVHTSWDAGQKLVDLLPAQAAGLVLRGSKAELGVHQLHQRGIGRLLLIDSESYKKAPATAEDPFVLPSGQLIPPTLDDVLRTQRDLGVTVALTPTGYLRAGDSEALKAAARGVGALDRDDVLFSVPIDIAWLNDDHIDQLIAVLARVDVPKAVFLGAQFDPLERYKTSRVNLRRLVAQAGHVSVLRTDLTGFDVLCHGAFATSIGTGGSLRHIIPFGESPRSSNVNDRSPSVLFTDLMAFFRGSKLATRFANTLSPACSCSACAGRRLGTFLGKSDSVAAHAHGVHIWSEWITDMRDQRTLGDRAVWWRNRCNAAVGHYDIVNAQLDQPGAFEPPEPLKAWAQLPAWFAPIQPAPDRSGIL